MNSRPIIFNTEMVQAILNGRKTQVRRPVVPSSSLFDGGPSLPNLWSALDFSKGIVDNGGPYLKVPTNSGRSTHRINSRFMPGDGLWVRENFWQKIGPKEFKFHATDKKPKNIGTKAGEWKSCPSVYMPFEIARIFLEVTGLRVERLQEVSEDDCTGEGLKLLQGGIRSEFAILWDSAHTARGFTWKDNPWVWVVEFKRVKK